MRASSCALVALLLLTAACDRQAAGPRIFAPDAYPTNLSSWQLLHRQGSELILAPDSLPYELATPLFSDYALKLRTIWLPPGTAAHYSEDRVFDFPEGTIISKTFYYPTADGDPTRVLLRDNPAQDHLARMHLSAGDSAASMELTHARLIETRLLVRQPTGWDALPYIWDDAQQDAYLSPTGAIKRLAAATDGSAAVEDLVYVVPNRNECAGCHATDQNEKALQPIGLVARHLNRKVDYWKGGEAGQLQHWVRTGTLRGMPAVAPSPLKDADLSAAARSYLDINCGHCHQPGGAADTSGLFLHASASEDLSLGLCKPPVAAGRGTGGHSYSIVPGHPEESILLYRMRSRELDVQMPELGRSLVHEEGVALIREWIAQLEGDC